MPKSFTICTLAAMVSWGIGCSDSGQQGEASELGFAISGVVGGNVLINWSIPNTPASGISNVTFPMTVNAATLHADGTYFAAQFNFTNQKDVGYTGLQPRPNLNGRERLHAAFSSFIPGTKSTDRNCSNGADGGPGVSCASDFDGVYGHTYALTVARTGSDTWSGTATDTVTGVASHIGTYTLPPGSGNIRGSQAGFVEYYLSSPSCAQLPKSDVVFGGPTSTDFGGLRGTSRTAYEYNGDCLGRANHFAENVGDGTHIIRGFVASQGAGASGRMLVNKRSRRCLDVPGANTANGTAMVLWDCHGGPNQQWAVGSGKTLMNSGKCLDAFAGGIAPGTKVILWDCHGGPNQQWNVGADGTVRGVQSGLCLAANTSVNGSVMTLATCNMASGQTWTWR